MSDTQANIVIDNGSGSIKCGFSSEEAPKSIFPNVISKDQTIIGDENLPDLIHPVEHGIITKWDEMEKIWQHTFTNELRVNSDERNVLISDPPIAPKINREKITQIMFEKFNVQGLFISVQALLSMYSVGKTTGLVVDSGDDVTNVVPIIEGYSFPYTISKVNFGGRAITNYLIDLLSKKGVSFNNTDTQIVRDIKEKVGTIYTESENEEKDPKINDIKYELPDGKEFKVGNERFMCAEAIFKPELKGKEVPGVQWMVYNSIQKSENEIRKDLYSNIILAGGNTLISSYPVRLTMEMQKLAPAAMVPKVKVVAQSERKYSAWIGGAILAGLSNFQSMWISHAEYQESGPQIVHRKCL